MYSIRSLSLSDLRSWRRLAFSGPRPACQEFCWEQGGPRVDVCQLLALLFTPKPALPPVVFWDGGADSVRSKVVQHASARAESLCIMHAAFRNCSHEPTRELPC